MMTSRTQNFYKAGLTLIELSSIIVIVIVILSIFIPWVSSYRLKTKASEARTNLTIIFDAEVLYYQHSQPENTDPDSEIPNTKIFLPLSSQPTQPGLTAQEGDFTHGDWALLNIKIANPVYYSYSVATKGEGNNANFTAIARGDLDGDGHFSRWEIKGKSNPKGEILRKNLIYSLDPLE